jgi:hypothetical protein
MTIQPLVSIILPTYNRADVLGRAVDSVRRQTMRDWELILVDDGSTDETAAWLATQDDQRIRVHRQANAGVYHARNAGLRLATGRYVTFQDSDDEWYPHYLALTTAFLEANPQQMFVTTEFHSHKNGLLDQVFDRVLVPAYAQRASSIGLGHCDIAQPKDDDYLRVYSQREPVGAWGRAIVHRLGQPAAQVYRGQLFQHMRWGYLNWLPITMLRREALEVIGEFSTETRSAADFRFMALLCKHFQAAMIAVPCAVKHENAPAGQKLKCDHLASGAGAHRFELNKLKFFDELFYTPNPKDPELQVIRRHYELWVGRTALAAGLLPAARAHLVRALSWHPAFWPAGLLWLVARLAPTPGIGAALLRTWEVGSRVGHRLISDRSALPAYARRLLGRTKRQPTGATVPGDLPLEKAR